MQVQYFCVLVDNVIETVFLERKSIRRSTAAKSAATQQRMKERTEEGRRRRGKRGSRSALEEYQPTQEELLEEAKITEEENLKSLGNKSELSIKIFLKLFFSFNL